METTIKGVQVLQKKPVTYNISPSKAIHLIRHPLDNVVARFHLDHGRQTRGEMTNPNATWSEIFPRNRTGFAQWCEFIDEKNHDLMTSRWVDPKLRHLLHSVPCFGEFFRYVSKETVY